MNTTPRLDDSHGPGVPDGSAGVTYQVTVAGHLDDHWSQWLGCSMVLRNDDASTTLVVTAADQAHLHGVLTGIRDIGARLLSLHPVERAPGGSTFVTSVLERPLRTHRLTLRPATEDDTELTWRYRQLDSVNEWLTGAPANLEAYRDLFGDPSRLATTVIVELADDQSHPVIGDFMLRLEDAWSQAETTDHAKNAQAELGWVLDPAHTGLGYATEAVQELLRFCFEELGVHRVVANCFLDNDTSWRLMQRVGMRRETHAVSESLHRSGRWLDTVGYAVLADEWTTAAHRPVPDEGEGT